MPMSEKEKPDWWPRDPFPEDIFPMARERYQEIVPDPDIRSALSGCLGRHFWGIASDAIWNAFRLAREEEDDISVAASVQPEGEPGEWRQALACARDYVGGVAPEDAIRKLRDGHVGQDQIEKILAILHNLESGLAMPFETVDPPDRYTDFETMVEVMRHTQRGLKKLIEDIEKEMPCGDP